MSCKSKNEYKEVAYLNQKGKYKSTSKCGSRRGSWIPKNTAPKEAPTGRTPLNLYSSTLSLSPISILIASLDLVDFYLMPWLFIS